MPIGVLLPEILYVRGGASARHAFTDEVIYFITDAGRMAMIGL